MCDMARVAAFMVWHLCLWDDKQWLRFDTVKATAADKKVWNFASDSSFSGFSDLNTGTFTSPGGWLTLPVLCVISPNSVLLPASPFSTIPTNSQPPWTVKLSQASKLGWQFNHCGGYGGGCVCVCGGGGEGLITAPVWELLVTSYPQIVIPD